MQRQILINPQELELTGGRSIVSMVIYCGFAFPLFGLAVALRDPVFILVLGFFAAAGVGGIVTMVRARRNMNRFGELTLRLDEPMPTVCGRLNGRLVLPPEVLAKAHTMHANLVCSKVVYGQQNRRTESALRGVRFVVPLRGKAPGGIVNLACVIPDGLPPASDPGPQASVLHEDYFIWQLKLTVRFGTNKLERSYRIPVEAKLPGAVAPEPEAAAAPLPEPVAAGAPLTTLRAGQRRAVASSRPVAAPSPGADPTPVEAPAPVDRSSLWLLVLMNLPVVVGVWFFGWRVRDVVLLYWIENLVIGLFNLLRIAVAVPDMLPDLQRRGIDFSSDDMTMAKAAAGAFFLVHYGAFCAVHGIFLAMMFASSDSLADTFRLVAGSALGLVAVLGIVLSHAYSFRHNYIVGGEYRHANFGELMMRPYKRIFVTHIFLIAGAFLLVGRGSPAAAIAVFIAIKIGFDAWFHRRERTVLSKAEA